MTRTCKFLQPVVSQIFFNPSSFWTIIWFWQELFVQDMSISKSKTIRLLLRLTAFVPYCLSLSFPLLAGMPLFHTAQPPRTLLSPHLAPQTSCSPSLLPGDPPGVPSIDLIDFLHDVYILGFESSSHFPLAALCSPHFPLPSLNNWTPFLLHAANSSFNFTVLLSFLALNFRLYALTS